MFFFKGLSDKTQVVAVESKHEKGMNRKALYSTTGKRFFYFINVSHFLLFPNNILKSFPFNRYE